MLRASVVFLLLLGFWGWAYAQEVSYREHIRPILKERCLGCHGPDSPEYKAFKLRKAHYIARGKGPRLDSYTYLVYFVGWQDTGALMRRLDDGTNTPDGSPGNMYRYLGDTEAQRQRNLRLFKRWVGHWSLKRWGQWSLKELQSLKLKY
jgi:mono/diheme cytochrome c family protein